MRTLALVVLLTGPLFAQDLTEKNYKKWRDHILPKSMELRWEKIDWRPTLWDGVIDAHKARKPILLYAMNGAVLGCV